MKKVTYLIGTLLLSVWLIMACSQQSPKQEESENKAVPTDMKPAASTVSIDPKLLALSNDPVCGMPIAEGIADTLSHEGKTYGFCSAECKDEFKKTPGQYLSKK